MTLGGLALAVGILVDDATVTIENINWHLEQDKDIETAIMDGARQIVVPATVSLLCICIVFVPMFSARRRLRLPVPPDGGGGRLRADRFLRALAHAGLDDGALSCSPLRRISIIITAAMRRRRAIRWRCSSAGSSAGSRRCAPSTCGCSRPRSAARWIFIAGFLVVVLCSFGLAPFLGQNFFPSVAEHRLKLHVRAPTGSRIEETAAICDQVEAAIRQTIPQRHGRTIVDNIGLPISGINLAYGNSGTVGSSDADILISLKDGEAEQSDDYVKTLRETLPRQFPGHDLRVPARRHRFADPQLRPAVADRRAGRSAPISGPTSTTPNELLRRSRGCRASPTRASSSRSTTRSSTSTSIAHSRAQIGLTEGDVAKSLQDTLSGSFAVAPTFWINPEERRRLSDRRADPAILGEFGFRARTMCRPRRTTRRRFSPASPTIKRSVSPSVVSHYDVQPVIDIYATNTRARPRRGLGRHQKIMADTAKDAPPGSTVVLRGQTSTMTSAYSQLFIGIALAIVLIYLLIVVNFQSWLDPFVIVSALPTALAGIVWMLFITRTTLSVPALTGAIMCMGVATANSILVVSFARERLAEGADRWTAALDGGPHPLPPGADDGAGHDHRHGADGAQRRAERAARPRRDRRPDLRDDRDAVLRARGVPARA